MESHGHKPASGIDTLAAAAFTRHADRVEALREAVGEGGERAAFEHLGESEEGRPVVAVVLGRGPLAVSLVAGAHADEPVGPETLASFVRGVLGRPDDFAGLLAQYRFVVVPHVNPDGEARNRAWIDAWPDPAAYLRHRVREEPGRDVEFGYPDMRRENRLVSALLARHAPFALHMSLHGMGLAEGAMLLVERHWAGRTQALRDRFVAAARAEGLGLHDHNRRGEKGFFYIEAGFWTTPEGAAMRAHFRGQGDEATARLFHDSSMEYVRGRGGDPLCLVTEVPLFALDPDPEAPCGVPARYLALRERLPRLRARLERGGDVGAELAYYDLHPVPVEAASRLQLVALGAGLAAIRDAARRGPS